MSRSPDLLAVDTRASLAWETPTLRVLTLRAWVTTGSTLQDSGIATRAVRNKAVPAPPSLPISGPLSISKDGSSFDLQMAHREGGKGGDNADGMQHNHN